MARAAPSAPKTPAVANPMLFILATPVMNATLPSSLPCMRALLMPSSRT